MRNGTTVHRQVLKGLVLLLAVLATAMAAAGCGGGGGDRHQGEAGGDAGCEQLKGESEREQCEKQQVAKKIPSADRIAYYQLATTAGLLRSSAIATARGLPAPVRAGRAEVAAARARVAQLDPRDRGLRRVQRQLRRLLDQEARGLGRADADRALGVLGRIDAQLNRYVRRREPAQAALVPD
jgi:hypothetical protein